jgi:transaldolase
MALTEASIPATDVARRLALQGYVHPDGAAFGSHPAWRALKEVGTELWLDTGDADAARALWTSEFTNLTTNNTLVNKEVQRGTLDRVAQEAGRAFRDADPGISPDELVLEVGFVLNCRVALHLVSTFDARVSVELHPGMSDDAARSIAYGRRYFAVCPERFIIKVPLTPAGFLAARQLSADGIPVNYTLGFSTRQNVLAAAFSRTTYVNVFMGRLNSLVTSHGLGDGTNVGERATAATQEALREGRKLLGWKTRLIGASMRSGAQAAALAGLDIFTLPPAAAEEFRDAYDRDPQPLTSYRARSFDTSSDLPPAFDALWTVEEELIDAAEALTRTDVSSWSGPELVTALKEALAGAGAAPLMREWSPEELAHIEADGKIPNWDRWKDALEAGRIALDELMTVSALYSFVADQKALDGRVRGILGEAGLIGR